MKKVKDGIWKDYMGNNHILEDEIWDNMKYIDSFVSYDCGSVSGIFRGLFYDDEDVYYKIERIDGKIEYCSCVGGLEVMR